MQDRLRLDAILTIVDAKHILPHLDEVKPEGVENEVRRCPLNRCRPQLSLVAVPHAASTLLTLPHALAARAWSQSVEQVAFADRILLNKIDLVDDATKKLVISKLKV